MEWRGSVLGSVLAYWAGREAGLLLAASDRIIEMRSVPEPVEGGGGR